MKKISKIGTFLICGLLSSALWANTATTNQIEPSSASVTTTTTVNTHSINLNQASAAEIQDKLVGIGAKKAQAIVEYREKNGKFVTLEQLTEVSGIGKATLEKNRDRIVLE